MDTQSREDDEVVIGTVATPIGPIGVARSARGVGRLTFATEPFDECAAWARRWLPAAPIVDDRRRLDDLAEQLDAYFAGKLRVFTIPLDLRGTDFQVRAWRAVERIAYGSVLTYAQVAAAIERPRAVRAVGAANGANPLPILIPCHRVIGSDGSLVKYGGGLALKRRLLEIEAASQAQTLRQPDEHGQEDQISEQRAQKEGE